jgi:mono/diheme cytochrome c family protein
VDWLLQYFLIMRPRVRKIVIGFGLGIAVVAVAIQLVPYGRDHGNPAVAGEPVWDRPATRALAVRACFDCHSNQVTWPWYSHVAPMSWLVQSHVDQGRRALNFSEWGHGGGEADDAAKVVRSGEMPPRSYTLMHPEARLSAEERAALAAGLATTVGQATPGAAGRDLD